jgi:hypothetical protein
MSPQDTKAEVLPAAQAATQAIHAPPGGDACVHDAQKSQKCVKQEHSLKPTRAEVAYVLIQAMEKPAGND